MYIRRLQTAELSLYVRAKVSVLIIRMNVGYISLRYFLLKYCWMLTDIMISSTPLHQFYKKFINRSGWTIKASVSCKISPLKPSEREREMRRIQESQATHSLPCDLNWKCRLTNCGGGQRRGRRHSWQRAAACRANVGPVQSPASQPLPFLYWT